ncbi:hypothetical protein [Tropicibacter alexandrii]|uniref:hypothetical protein n=1 Tax=Tropicibacter alexandrii TaxID=2267683 RepID=UPI000EF4E111|nr:hypothetical protein [Tropicibacter alexandrii]
MSLPTFETKTRDWEIAFAHSDGFGLGLAFETHGFIMHSPSLGVLVALQTMAVSLMTAPKLPETSSKVVDTFKKIKSETESLSGHSHPAFFRVSAQTSFSCNDLDCCQVYFTVYDPAMLAPQANAAGMMLRTSIKNQPLFDANILVPSAILPSLSLGSALMKVTQAALFD